MFIINKHCTIFTNLYQADTWEGPEGVYLIEVSLEIRKTYMYNDKLRHTPVEVLKYQI